MIRLNHKNKLLLAGLILVALVCYRFAIVKTIATYKTYQQLQELSNSSANQIQTLEMMLQKEIQLDKALSAYTSLAGDSFQNSLLEKLSLLSKQYKIQITGFNEPHRIVDQTTSSTAYAFSLKGKFSAILLLVNKLENDPGLGLIKHVHFEKKRNYKNNTDYLTADIILFKNEHSPLRE